MDDYQKEIADLEIQVEQLVEAEGDAKTIAELSMQLEILRAIYSRALDLLTRGRSDDALRYGLRIRVTAIGPSIMSTLSCTSAQSSWSPRRTAPSWGHQNH